MKKLGQASLDPVFWVTISSGGFIDAAHPHQPQTTSARSYSVWSESTAVGPTRFTASIPSSLDRSDLYISLVPMIW